MTFLTALTCAALACADHPSLVGPPLVGVAAQSVTMLTGCAQFEIRLEGERRATVSGIVQPGCGPIRPRIDSVMFDRSRGLLRLAVSLQNAGTASVTVPARLLVSEHSLVLIEPPGLGANRHEADYLTLRGFDSALADATLLWMYDTLLGSGDRPLLTAGGVSAPRWIEISAHQGVLALGIRLHAEARRTATLVPAIPPDSVPSGLPSASVPGDTLVRFVRDVLVVGFRPGTPQVDREAVIAEVGGEVIGGIRLSPTDGFYYVRVAAEGSYARLVEHLRSLRRMPQVAYVTLDFVELVTPNYLAPVDGTGWTRWQTTATGADGDNWALEAMRAPLAWGCATGGEGASVAVVDRGFRSVPDLASNVASVERLDQDRDRYHGTEVASVIAARGNNGVGMTGMMWRAGLRLYDATTVDSSGQRVMTMSASMWAVGRAANAGARVINLSLGIYWKNPHGHNRLPRDTSTADSLEARGARDLLAGGLRYLADFGKRPLVVVGAGNDGIDAWWSGYPAARDSFPNQVIVVGGSTRAGVLATYSNRGRLVDVVAPTQRVFTLRDSVSGPVPDSGTSLSAPLVTGLAGLLLSLDSTLTADSLKALIVEGARRSGRLAGTLPISDAYESLRAAAEAQRGPLCGNRIWATGGQLIAERNRSAGTSEVLADIGEPAYDLNARHGGRRIEFRGDNSHTRRAFVLGLGGTWSEVPATDTTARLADGGTFLSAGQLSHNGDSGVVLRQVPAGYEVIVIDGHSRSREVIATIPATADYSGLYDGCTLWDGPHVTCQYPAAFGSWVTPIARVAYAPQGDRVYVAVGTSNGTSSITGEVAGPVPTDPHPCFEGCWFATWETRTVTSGGPLYVVNIRGDRTPRMVGPLAVAPAWLAVSEDGAEVIVGRGTTTTASTGIGDFQESASFAQANCGLTFVTSAGGTTTRTVAVPEVCTQFQGTGTIAPVARPQIARAARPSVGRPEHSAQRLARVARP